MCTLKIISSSVSTKHNQYMILVSSLNKLYWPISKIPSILCLVSLSVQMYMSGHRYSVTWTFILYIESVVAVTVYPNCLLHVVVQSRCLFYSGLVALVVLPAAVDRLGDAKAQVRDQAAETILKLMVPASHPQVGDNRPLGEVSTGPLGGSIGLFFWFCSKL